MRVAVLTYVAMPVLQLVALARFSSTLNWGGAGAWLYALSLLSILFLGLFGVRRTWLAPREEATPAVAPAAR